MKRALLVSPLMAAILFTLPESWQLMHRPDSSYIPVVFEILLLGFGYVAAALINLVLVIPLCLLVKLKTSNLLAGIGLGLFVALIGTTVAYAYEIFDYQTSILHSAYLYPLLIPLFALTVASFFFVTRTKRVVPASARGSTAKGSEEKDGEV